jgi:hypothetical protein
MSGGQGHVAHLVRRFWGSLSSAPPDAGDVEWARAHLTAAEAEMWDAMAPQDRRHSIAVARCVAASEPGREVVAGALLHDVGKTASGLNTWERVAATLVGPRGARFERYHDHERIGSAMATEAGSDEVTVALIRGEGPAAEILRTCDDA